MGNTVEMAGGDMYYVITNVGHAMPELVSKLIQDL